MSFAATTFVRSLGLARSRHSVALAIAARANEEGEAWPAVRTIAAEAGCEERTARYALRALERCGVIRSYQVVGSSTHYFINFDVPPVAKRRRRKRFHDPRQMELPLPYIAPRGGASFAPESSLQTTTKKASVLRTAFAPPKGANDNENVRAAPAMGQGNRPPAAIEPVRQAAESAAGPSPGAPPQKPHLDAHARDAAEDDKDPPGQRQVDQVGGVEQAAQGIGSGAAAAGLHGRASRSGLPTESRGPGEGGLAQTLAGFMHAMHKTVGADDHSRRFMHNSGPLVHNPGSEVGIAQNAPPGDARDILWNQGLTTLARLTGKPRNSCRSLLGKLVNNMHDDCAALGQLLAQTEEDRRIAPVDWLIAATRAKGTRGAGVREVLDDMRAELAAHVATVNANPFLSGGFLP